MFQPLQGKALTAGITATSGLGFLLFGYDQGLFSGLLSISSFSKTFNHPNAVIQGQIVSSYDLGCIIGAALSFFIGDRLGRRRAIFLGCTIIIVGGTLQATSFALSQMIVARIVTGVGTGINTTAIPLWQSETSEARHRGKLIVLQLFLLICGLVITNLLNLGLTYVDPANEFTWRFPLAFQCVFALLTMTLLTFMPESPRWLVLKDRPTEAHAIIARLMGRPSDNDEVLLNLQSILDTVQYEQETQQKSTIKELFSGGRQQTFRRIVLGASASFMQQIGGTNVIAYYLSVILKDSFGFSSRMALILSVVDFILYSIWTLIGTQLIDRVGRKNLLLVGAVGQSICFGMAALGLSIGNKPMNGFAVAFIFLFYVFHASSYSPIPFIYPSEINSQRTRNSGAAVAMMIQWLFVYVIVLITPIGIANLGWKFYLIFCAINISFVPFIWYFYIETASLTLEQIDRIFDVKYEGGSAMSYREATRVVREEGNLQQVYGEKTATMNVERVLHLEKAS